MNVAVNVNANNPVSYRPHRPVFDFPKEFDARPFWAFVEALGIDQYLLREPLETDREKAFRIAREQTKFNSQGLAVIERDDDWFDDDVWEEDYQELEIAYSYFINRKK